LLEQPLAGNVNHLTYADEGWMKEDITLKVTAKGQVTLRKEVLRHLGVEPGQTVAVELLPGARAALRAAPAKGTIRDFFGSLSRPGTQPLTIEEMGEVAAEGWAGKR
jgi:antitoxin PrlF